MKNWLIIILLFPCVTLFSQEIFKSDAFTITSDKVVQENFEAKAKSRTEIVSNYKSSFKTRTHNRITFKFSINGLDNEAVPGQDHIYFITPIDGKDTSNIFVFGKPDQNSSVNQPERFLQVKTDLLLRVDINDVLKDFKEKGFFQTFDGNKISRQDFKGVFVAGSTAPLTWDWNSLPNRNDLQLKDPNGNGIYEILLHIEKEFSPVDDSKSDWKLSKDISAFPKYKSSSNLIDALYNMSLEEMILNVRSDGSFMAGEKWPGVWTRDLSYSIILAMAIINPDASKTSLMAKVKNNRIIQDTGTGGSWPISSDRMVWSVAAWEIYLVTGDKDWLKSSYGIIKNSALDDLNTVLDPSSGLFKGESSFLDWREQTYPRWMDPKDIYTSKNLGTNAIHFQTYKILSEMAKQLGESSDQFAKTAENIKNRINKNLWMKDKEYFGQYLYGRNFQSLSPRSEALGEALTVLFEIADADQQKKIIANTPVTKFGIPCIYPQIPNIPPYHNDAIWPFVEAYWAWASAKTGNATSVEYALASIYRAASLFLTNKENMVATSGDYLGTEINSSRQLWSVAGNLSTIYRVLFGMNFTQDGLKLNPFIPKSYDGTRELNNFKYRKSILTISIDGYGNEIKSIRLDGKEISSAIIPADLSGAHQVKIQMANKIDGTSKINLVENYYSIETPVVKVENNTLKWNAVEGTTLYHIFKNGKKVGDTHDSFYLLDDTVYAEYQVAAIDKMNSQSFLSEPVVVSNVLPTMIEAEYLKRENNDMYISNIVSLTDSLKTKIKDIDFKVDIKTDGFYLIDFHYANGNGPINTDNKCAIRTLLINDKVIGPVVFPQRGIDKWNDWGYSNSFLINLKKGKHKITLTFRSSDNNMNGKVNSALVDNLRISLIEKN
ncbi:MAG: hypothetical protein NTX22_09045 [Ignavibacteriales bacterium]|nr:hypothetical protein [Ignavibacteriales bacterium]